MSTTLPLARYRFTFRMVEPLRLPEYAGSLLRGQFGAALRKLACMTGEPDCSACPLLATCPYPAIFETPAPEHHAMQRFSKVPNPYVIEPPAFGERLIDRGEALQFSMVLIGHAAAQLPLVSLALQRALEGGLGRERSRGRLEAIEMQDGAAGQTTFIPLWQHGDARIAAHAATLALPESGGIDSITLQLRTPLRLQQQGRPIRPEALSPRKLLADLLRRASLLFEFHAGETRLVRDVSELVREAEALRQRSALHWQDWSRFSSRQQREMTLGGVLGEWTLEGDLSRLFPWLWLGQWLHVGKNATMGMGRYEIQTPCQ